MTNIIQNKIKNYSEMFTYTGPVQVSDFISSKYDNIHKMLYTKAIELFLKNKANDEDTTVDDIKKNNKFIEIKGSEWYTVPEVIMIERAYPHTKTRIDISKYWDSYQEVLDNKNITDIMFDDESVKDCEIIDIDYINGQAKMKSKITDKSFNIPFNFIRYDTNLSDDIVL